ncbi:dihydrolipoyl dehydrogenase family protein [Campylobacter concisus]|uniref:dihydrolipoyl dehydrogenase family protein n=1 Tax=Campylobacter concisus TaxID=199 RepID=UPI00122C437A|nr:NAD(P)/FAD-dependent oxidoreductase [Campylobacter concisus]
MKYDIVIIGFGKAGKTLAVKAAALGKKVALVERSPKMYGGTCINVGCIPTKRLITAAKEAKFVNNSVESEYYTLSVENKNKLISALNAKNYAMLNDKENIDVIDGVGSFASENSVLVTTPSGEKKIIEGDFIIINSGSKEADTPFEVVNSNVFSSQTLLDLKNLPKHFVIIGSGFIGIEFASMFANFGSKVTIIGRSKLLKNEDDDIANSVKEALRVQGVEILEGCEIECIKENILNFKQNGEQRCLRADAFLIALGRVANVDDLNLKAAGAELNEKGFIKTNENLQTNVPNIYAVGDVRGGELFTYTSLDDFRIVYSQIFGDKKRNTKNRSIHANVLFTDTPLARVGVNAKEASKFGLNFKELKLSMATVPGAKVLNHDVGMLKAIVDAQSGEILGASFHCIYANELINEIAIAMNLKANANFFKNQIFTHPSISEALNDLFGQF